MPQATAVIDRIRERVYELKYLNSDDVVGLVSQWLKEFYDEKGLTHPHSVYPFHEDELRKLSNEKPIVRSVLKWCADKFKPPGNGDNKKLHPVETAFDSKIAALEESIEDYSEDKVELADALYLSFFALIGETVEGVEVEDIAAISAKNADQDYIDFKVIGKENGKLVKIGVFVCQQSGGNSVQAALKRLIDYKNFDLTRGCLVCSKKINPNAKSAQNYLHQLFQKQGGEWVLLQSKDIKPLLAMSFVDYAHKDYELSEEENFDLIKQNKRQ